MAVITQDNPADVTVPALARRDRRPRLSPSVLAYLFPALALYALFVIAPLAQAMFLSVFKWNGLGTLDNFVGFANYLKLFQDAHFLHALINNVAVIVVSLGLQLPLALWIATLLNGKFPGRTVFRVVFFVPYIISEVVAAVLWKMLLAPSGFVNALFTEIGLENLAHSWLADPDTVVAALLLVVVWKFFGFYTVLFLAAIQGIPSEHLEAAKIDGANRWQSFWNVSLPAIGPTVRIAGFLSLVGSIQLFDIVWVMTGGGPVGASETAVTYMMSKGLKSYEFGYGSAVAVTVAIISFAIAIAYQKYILARDNDGMG